MTNTELLAKIKTEIERRIALYSSLSENTVNPNRIDEDRQILSFLSTLESEKPMNLEEEINRYLHEECSDDDEPGIHEIAEHFAQWGAEHLANSNDEIVINGHMVAYNKNKDAITMEEIPNELEEAARHSEILTYPMPEDGDIKKVFEVQEARVFHEIGFIAGAKWQAEQLLKSSPIPEDTVLFNKGVEEGKRLAEEEQADLFTIVALDAAQRAKEQMLKEAVEGTIDYVYDEKGDAYKAIRIDWLVGDFGDKVRVIVLPQKD